jgi:hypothetical protein
MNPTAKRKKLNVDIAESPESNPSEACFFFCFVFFLIVAFVWQYWGFNSGPQACWTAALPLEPRLQPFFVLVLWPIQIGSIIIIIVVVVIIIIICN